MATKTVGTPGTQSLDDFQTVVQQQEGIFGPLFGLGKDGANNTITLTIGPKPAKRAVLATYSGDTPPQRDGHEIICSAECLVEEHSVKVVAYRPL